MAILRKDNRARYTVVSQDILMDERLSLKEVGLLVKMLSLPDNWEFSESGLLQILKRDGKASIKSGLKTLEDCRYLKRTQLRAEDGKMNGVEWILSESPMSDFPTSGKPTSGKPTSENQPQYNTKESNTKEPNTELYDRIIEHLNEMADTKYKSTSAYIRRYINGRLDEGFTYEDFETVIDKMCGKWMGTKMQEYLRPQTLFSTKFESYLNAPMGKEKYGMEHDPSSGRRDDREPDEEIERGWKTMFGG